MCPFLSGFFHPASCLHGSCMLQRVSTCRFFLRLDNIMVCLYIPYFAYSSVYGHFPPMAVVTNAVKNVVVQIPVWAPAASSVGCIPRDVLAGSDGHSTELLEELFPTVAGPLCIPQQCPGAPVSPHPHQHVFFRLWQSPSRWV